MGDYLSATVTVMAAAVALSVAGVMPAQAAAGDLDTGFDSDGKVTTQMGSGISVANAIVYDGSAVVVAGRVGSAGTDGAFGLARYNSNGSLDTAFDTDGKVTTDFSSLADVPRDILLQTVENETKYLVGGLVDSEPAGDFILARYNNNGSLDTTFGASSGYTRTDISGVGDGIRGLAMDANGKIIAVGPAGSDSAIVRYNSNGTLDTGFDTDGVVLSNTGVGDHFFNIALDGNGKYVIAGTVDGDFLVARYNTNGTLDTGFDTDGKVTTNFTSTQGAAADGIRGAVLISNKVTAAGFCGEAHGITSFLDPAVGDFCLARYDAGDGSLDTTFSGDGKVVTDFTGDGARAIAPNSNNDRVTVAGGANAPTDLDFALSRYEH